MQSAKPEIDSPQQQSQAEPDEPKLSRYVACTALAWTVVVAVSLALNIRDQDRGALEVAHMHAATAFEKDLSYRRWVASHNVYVRLEAGASPNPHLEGFPERDIQLPGGKLTYVNPATMSRQVYELERRSSQLRSHITSLKPLRPENAPDAWEEKALLALQRGAPEVCSIDQLDGIDYMRLMRPLFTEQSCLRCHLEQGYKVGDLRGGITVAVPMDDLRQVSQAHKKALIAGHVFLWLLGLAGISAARRMLSRQIRSRLLAERELQQSESRLQILAEQNARLDAEQSLLATREKLHLAATLQKRLLPQGMPVLSGYDFAAILDPCDETAGDFYDFLMMNDGSLAVVLGDVSGHGIDAALLMSATIGHLRVLATHCDDAGELLSRLNELIAEEADGRFISLFVAQLDPAAGRLSYSSAGHPGYLIKPDGTFEVLDTPCLPVGILPELETTTSPAVTLAPGEIVLMYTDGLSEATNAGGELYGAKRILENVHAHRECEADTILNMLCDDIRRYISGAEQNDDMTAVILKRS